MKRQVRIAAVPARRHRDLLEERWEETDLSRAQARMLDRMDKILERLPYAAKQAHERIVGKRRVAWNLLTHSLWVLAGLPGANCAKPAEASGISDRATQAGQPEVCALCAEKVSQTGLRRLTRVAL